MPTTNLVVPGNWASVKNGKWHIATTEKPDPRQKATSLCGLSFYPLNVTWGEAPQTNDYHVCTRCAAATAEG